MIKIFSIFLILLSLLDISAGVLIYFHTFPLFQKVFYYMAFALLAKGTITMMGSIPTGDIQMNIMGIIDVIAGTVMILLSYGFSFGFFNICRNCRDSKGSVFFGDVLLLNIR